MRAKSVGYVATALVIAALCGCRTGGAPTSPWSLNAKNKAPAGANASALATTPQLPSASATASTSNPSPYPTTAGAPPSGNPYPGANNVAGGYPTTPGSPYPGQPTGYSNPAYPPNAQSPGAPGTNPYGNVPAGYGGTVAANPAAAGGMAPQAGPYNEAYNQGPPAGGYANNSNPAAYQAGSYPSTGAPGGNGAGGYPDTTQQPPSHQPPTDPYATTNQHPYANQNPYNNSGQSSSTMPADPYGSSAQAPADPYANSGPDNSSQSRYTSDTRYNDTGSNNDRYNTNPAQPEQTAADRYAAANMAAGDPPLTDSPRDDRYQPGNNGYVPGHNGYTPPGVPPYQSPAQLNVTPPGATLPARRDPYYRPGGTSDYIPQSGSQVPTTSTDRYTPQGRLLGGDDPFAGRAQLPASGYPAEPVRAY